MNYFKDISKKTAAHFKGFCNLNNEVLTNANISVHKSLHIQKRRNNCYNRQLHENLTISIKSISQKRFE